MGPRPSPNDCFQHHRLLLSVEEEQPRNDEVRRRTRTKTKTKLGFVLLAVVVVVAIIGNNMLPTAFSSSPSKRLLSRLVLESSKKQQQQQRSKTSAKAALWKSTRIPSTGSGSSSMFRIRLPMLPMADAFGVPPVTPQPPIAVASRTNKASSASRFRWFVSSSSLEAVVVPELDDSFSEDYGNSNNNNSNNNEPKQGFPPPVVGEDYFPGVQDFELNEPPPSQGDDYYGNGGGYGGGGGGYTSTNNKEKEVINPFPFPGPAFSYTEEGITSTSTTGGKTSVNGNEPRFDASTATPYSVPQPLATDGSYDFNFNRQTTARTTTTQSSSTTTKSSETSTNIVPDDDDEAAAAAAAAAWRNNSSGDDSDDASTSSTMKNKLFTIENNHNEIVSASIGSSNTDNTNSNSDSKNDTGKRTIATVANQNQTTKDELQSTRDRFEEQLPAPMDEADREVFAPFDSVVEDSGPVTPLVSPLKLSRPPSDTLAADDTAEAAVPSIEANGLDDLVDSLQGQLKSIEREIETLAPPPASTEATTKATKKAKPINLNSPKQVSQLLFGRPGMTTDKSTLEGMAASNIMAKLVLEYRDTKRRLKKVAKQQELRNDNKNNQAFSSDPTTESSSSSSSPPPRAMKDPVLLFDTSSFIFRAYYSSPPIHRGRDGMPIGAVMGFCSMLNKLLLTSMIKGETPVLIQCLDAPGPSFRKELYPDYKAQRPPVPLDLVPQFDLINKAARAYGMIQIQATGFEADDVIATLATIGSQTEGLDVKILSGDKDLMQLVTEDENESENEANDGAPGMVHMLDPMTSKVWNHARVVERWGVKASQLGDVLALAGDAADNIPGVPGIGPKIASQLLQEFGTLESLLESTDQIPQPKRREKLETNAGLARISRELVELERGLDWSQMEAYHPPAILDETDFDTTATGTTDNQDFDAGSATAPTPLPESTKIGGLRMQPIQPDRILAFYDDMGFHKLKTQLLDRLSKLQTTGGSSSSRPTTTTRPMEDASLPPPPPKPVSKRAATPKATAPTVANATTANITKAKPKRNFWEKIKRGVPKPEDFRDVPF